MVTDDLDGVLVCTNGTVSAQTPELAGDGSLCGGIGSGLLFERKTGNVINDSDGEAVLGLILGKVLVNCKDGLGRSILGAKSVASAYDSLLQTLGCKSGNNVKIQRLTERAGLLGSVKNCDLGSSLGDSFNKLVCSEGSVKTNLNKADLFALRHHIIDNFLCNVTNRAHSNDNSVCLGMTVVVEELVVGTDLLVYLVHIFLDDLGELLIVTVASLSVLEEDIAVFSRSSEHGMLGVYCSCAECGNSVLIDHFIELFVIPNLDLLDLVRGTEAIEEVENGNSALDGCKMSNRAKIHNLLRVGLGKHCITGLTASIYVRMVTENIKSVGSNTTCTYVDDVGEKLTCDLVHIGDHQKKTLRSSEGGGKSTCCQRTVNGTCSTRLRLHFNYLYLVVKNVLETGSRPSICKLSHNAGRCDRIDCGNLGKRIANVRCGCVAVHGKFLSCHSFISPLFYLFNHIIITPKLNFVNSFPLNFLFFSRKLFLIKPFY